MRSILFYFSFTIIIAACGPKVIYEEHIETNTPWSYDQNVVFNYNIQDTSVSYDLIMSIHHDNDFGYENLYVEAETTFPDKTIIKNTVSFQLANEMGQWIGKCTKEKCITQITISQGAFFQAIGDYSLGLRQYSRSNGLNGIQGFDLRIQTTENK